MGLLIAAGLIAMIAAAILIRGSARSLLVAIVLAAGSAVAWLVWARGEYQGLTSCPWDAQKTVHPVLVGLAVTVGSAAIAFWTRWRRDA